MAINKLPNTDNRDGLFNVTGRKNSSRKIDVVFLHGLGGDAFTTWMADPKNISTFWPNWLAEDFPDAGVWTIGYSAERSKWKENSMPLADSGTQLLDLLEIGGLGDRPLVFITHSMGGIIVKQLLRHAESFGVDRWGKIADQTKGVVFISTPHNGSNLANFLQYASMVYRTGEQVKELTAHNSRLRELHNWFRNYYLKHNLVCRSYCEEYEVRIKKFGLTIPKGIVVVDKSSAEPDLPGEIAVPLSEDHISITKPNPKRMQIYLGIRSWLRDCLEVLSEEREDKIYTEKAKLDNISSEESETLTEGSTFPPALIVWKEKLTFLQEEQAKVVDSEQKFTLKKRIEECEEHIRKLGAVYE